MGCVAASGYTSGTILATYSTGDASQNMADCLESCGICCYPICDTSSKSISCSGEVVDNQTSEFGYEVYYTDHSAGQGGLPFNASGLFTAGYNPLPADHIYASRRYLCEGSIVDGCGNSSIGIKEGFQAKVLKCNLDGTWTDVSASAFSNMQEGASCAGHYESNLFHGNYLGGNYWNTETCAMAEGYCITLEPFAETFGPWYDWEYGYELTYTRGDVTIDGSNCPAGDSCITMGPYNQECDSDDNHCYSAEGAEGYTPPCLGFCEWTTQSSNVTFQCSDSGQTNCDSMQGLWITGTTCETYDCSVHNI